jgi:tetratricopeptide (TPR) repeat protein
MKANHNRARSVHTASRLRSCFRQKKTGQVKPKRNLILTQYDNNTLSMRRDRLSSICSSTKKQKCTTPKSILTNNANTKLVNRGLKPKEKTFLFSQRRKTRKSSKTKENKFYSRIAKRLNTTVNIASPLGSDGFGDPKYFNFAKHFANGNGGVPRATMTNALLSPNLMSTLKAIKKRNNSLGIVSKYNTLNSSSGSIKDTYLKPLGDSAERKSENEKEQDEIFYKGIKSLDEGDPNKAISHFTKIVQTTSKKMVYIVLSIAYRRVQNYTEALKILSKAIAKHPKFVEAYVARGQIYLFLKKWDKAFIDFRKVLQLQKSIEVASKNKSAEVLPSGGGNSDSRWCYI